MDIEAAKKLRKECRFAEAAEAAQHLVDTETEECARARSLCALAFARYSCDQLDESWRAIDEALSLAGRLKSEQLQGHALRILGVLQWLQGNYSDAITSCRLAWRIAKDSSDRELLYLCGVSIGSALVYTGEFEEAIRMLSDAIDVAREYEDWHQIAVANTNLGVAFSSLGNPDQGLIHHRRTEKIYLQYPDPQRMALCLMNIAVIHAEKENYEESLDFYAKALQYLPENARALIRGAIHSNIGQSLYWLDRIPEACDALEKGLKGFEQAKYVPGKAETLAYLSCARIRMNQKEEGLALCKESMNLSELIGRKDIKVNIRLLMGCAYYLAGEPDSATYHLEAAHAMAQIAGIKRIEKYAQQFLDKIHENRREQ